MSIAERLKTLPFNVDETPHIVVDGGQCRGCDTHACLTFCPAQCFTPDGKGGIDYYYIGCIECGTCPSLGTVFRFHFVVFGESRHR